MLAMPVAAIGWPFDSRPPETLTGVEPSRHGRARLEEVDGAALLAQHQVVVVDELGGGEAVVQLDEVEVGRGRRRPARRPAAAALRVSVLTSGRTWHASCHGSVVSTDAETFTARRCCSRLSVFSFASDTDDRGRGAVAVRRAHRPRVRVGDHHVVHDLVEGHLLRVGGERVQRRVRVVLLGDAREQLEARAAVLVAVLHADLREHAGHRVGADAAVDRGDRAVAAARRPVRVGRTRRRPPAGRRRRASRRRPRGPCRTRRP